MSDAGAVARNPASGAHFECKVDLSNPTPESLDAIKSDLIRKIAEDVSHELQQGERDVAIMEHDRHYSNSPVSDLRNTFAWRSNVVLARAQSEFVGHQASAFLAHLDRLRALDNERASQLELLMSQAHPRSILRVLTAPEVTRRLRVRTSNSILDCAHFLATALAAEAAVRGTSSIETPMWTAVGDKFVSPLGEISVPLCVDGYQAIDVASPQARSMDPSSAICKKRICRAPISGSVRTRVEDLLIEGSEGIQAVSTFAWALVSGCVTNLVIVEEPEVYFSSCTNGFYIGRVAIASKDWFVTKVADLVGSLVHEAIHCLLLMLNFCTPLIVDDEAVNRLDPVTSPWTNNPLPISTYVHACMVWYGLASFWQLAQEVAVFDAGTIERMYDQARRGFLRGDILSQLSPEAIELVSYSARRQIQGMQESILAAQVADGAKYFGSAI